MSKKENLAFKLTIVRDNERGILIQSKKYCDKYIDINPTELMMLSNKLSSIALAGIEVIRHSIAECNECTACKDENCLYKNIVKKLNIDKNSKQDKLFWKQVWKELTNHG